MTIATKSPFIASVLVSLLAIAFLAWAAPVHANPSGLQTSNQNATTSVTYMTTGAATTTYIYDTQSGTNLAADVATFLVQFTGSSTPLSVLNIAFEYAQMPQSGIKCDVTPTACDWYRDTIYNTPISTTTQSVNVAVPTNYTLTMASTSPGGLAAITTRQTRIINVAVPTRYVRAVLTLPASSQPGAVWGTFVGKKQTP